MAFALDIGVTAWSPRGNGILTGKYNKRKENTQKRNKEENEDVKEQKSSSPISNEEVNEDSNSNINSNKISRLDIFKDMSPDLVNTRLTGRNILITEVIQIAGQIDLSPAQVALNWIKQEQNISPFVKIELYPSFAREKNHR